MRLFTTIGFLSPDSGATSGGPRGGTESRAEQASTYGGVVMDDVGRVLVREPRNHFSGYVWTFPKGHPDPGETPEEAARREVFEETGVTATIVRAIPGVFPGQGTRTIYYLMVPEGRAGEWGPETEAIRWATREEAEELLAQTLHPEGRERDRRVLHAAFALAIQLHEESNGRLFPHVSSAERATDAQGQGERRRAQVEGTEG
jgi:8-oxo-dGTP pyrophosphatase MutT (NUDIX family)